MNIVHIQIIRITGMDLYLYLLCIIRHNIKLNAYNNIQNQQNITSDHAVTTFLFHKLNIYGK